MQCFHLYTRLNSWIKSYKVLFYYLWYMGISVSRKGVVAIVWMVLEAGTWLVFAGLSTLDRRLGWGNLISVTQLCLPSLPLTPGREGGLLHWRAWGTQACFCFSSSPSFFGATGPGRNSSCSAQREENCRTSPVSWQPGKLGWLLGCSLQVYHSSHNSLHLPSPS